MKVFTLIIAMFMVCLIGDKTYAWPFCDRPVPVIPQVIVQPVVPVPAAIAYQYYVPVTVVYQPVVVYQPYVTTQVEYRTVQVSIPPNRYVWYPARY